VGFIKKSNKKSNIFDDDNEEKRGKGGKRLIYFVHIFAGAKKIFLACGRQNCL
jgi:hypothetical protein